MPAALSGTSLTEESWGDLFDFLDPNRVDKAGPDRDQGAEAKCVEITRKLVCFFAGRGCADAEDLAMDTILRVAGKCRTVATATYDDRIGYFYGVARNVLHEWQRQSVHERTKREETRREPSLLPIPNHQAWKDKEAVDRCLEQCMASLKGRARRLILQYYAHDKTEKVERHRRLADEFGKSVNALRIEVHRIRTTLRECVSGCLHPGAGGPPKVGVPPGVKRFTHRRHSGVETDARDDLPGAGGGGRGHESQSRKGGLGFPPGSGRAAHDRGRHARTEHGRR